MKPYDQDQSHPLTAHIEPLLAAAYRLCGDLDTAQELTQQTLLCALVALERGERIDNPGGYLHTVLRRRYNDMLRRKYHRPTVSIDCGAEDAIAMLADPDADFVAQMQLDEAQKERAEKCRRATDAFADAIRTPLAAYCKTHKMDIPSHLDSVPDQKRTMPYEPAPMMFVYGAIGAGLPPVTLAAVPKPSACLTDCSVPAY